ncbi:expansin-B15-like [Impatiens glandulifera]|uniref:expansin-B15-like n=1 Tax=Impatiens glandulifera TaxID=253017 RepID=UPI001FB1373B|nr:expansin-B15-like [Impatiens glandulifera]
MFSVSASPTIATWYGPANGAGTDGGACGYGNTVESNYGKFVTAVGNGLFKGGQECGACYQVQCSSHPACSKNPIKVVVSDQCPGCNPFQFDLSGTAFGALASTGKAAELRNAGKIQINYQRVPCQYGKKIKFVVDKGSNPNYIAVNIEEEGGDGDLSKVEIKQGSGEFRVAHQIFGATWGINSLVPGPLSIRLTTSSGRSVIANNVIPAGWHPGATYISSVQF